MVNKKKALDTVHKGNEKVKEIYKNVESVFDYGPLDRLAEFKGSHPKVMQNMINQMDWEDKLQYKGKPNPNRKLHKHERLKYRILTWIEQNLLGGKQIGGFNNYKLIKEV